MKFKNGGELAILRGNPVSTTAQYLRDRLDDVARGDVLGVATVLVYSDGSIGTGWSEGCVNSVFDTLGGIENLKQRFWCEGMENE